MNGTNSMNRQQAEARRQQRLRDYALAHLERPLRSNDGSIASPCVNICVINKRTDECEGCLRTLGEITAWGHAGEGEKQRIRQQCRQRAQRLLGSCGDGQAV